MAEYQEINAIYDEYNRPLVNRLSRLSGQILGIKKMVEERAECEDVLIQVSAAKSALDGFAREYLVRYIETEFKERIKENEEEAEKLTRMLLKFMR